MPALHHRRAAALAVVITVLLAPEAWGVTTPGVVTVAHRGASSSAPENTLSALSQALASRADFVELDVRLTRDGVPVLMHDPTLARTTDVESVFPGRSPWRVGDLTLDEVKRLDAGSWLSPSFAKERVPTLAAVVDQLSQSPNGAIVEVKDPSSYGGVDGIGAKVYDTVRASWAEALASSGSRRLLVASVDEGFVEGFAAKHPDVDVSVISRIRPADTVMTYADDIEVRYDQADAQLAGEAHAAGVTLGAWTVDDPAVMQALADHVDSITTNDPARLRRILADQGRLYTGTSWPAKESERPSWSLGTSGHYLNRPVAVRGTFTTASGAAARWQRAAVQRRVDGRWRTVLRRATDAYGRFIARIPGTRRLRIRVVSLDDWHYPIAASAAQDVPLGKVGTSIQLSGPRSVRLGDSGTLTVRWRTSDNRAISGRSRLFRYRKGAWHAMRDLAVSNGYARTRVGPARTTRYQVRGLSGWWYSGDKDGTRVEVRG